MVLPGAAIGWFSAALVLFLPLAAFAQGNPLEYAVKATYLYKFAPFVDWPPSVALPPAADFPLCVVGEDPFEAVLDRAVSGQRVEDHPLAIRRLPALRPDSGCRIAFLAGSTAQSVADALRVAAGTPVLTVTDGIAPNGPKGIVNFVIDSNRVRFEIDNGAAQRSGLAISSKLLSLAVR